MKKPYEEQTSL